MKKNKNLFYGRARELPSRMRVARGATGVTVRAYAYDSVGRVLSRKTARLGKVVSDSFGYNTRSELVSAVLGSSEYAYDFDSIGNRLSSSEAGTQLAYAANALNQYVSMGERSGRSDTLVASAMGEAASSPLSPDAGTTENAFSPTYDLDGNMTLIQTSTGTWSVSYNAENRPVRFENTETGTIVECSYDFKGRRFEKKVTREGSVILHHRYVYDGYLQIAAIDLTRSNAPSLWLVLWDPSQPTATRPLALQRYGKWFTYGWDLTKNVTELFGSDSGIKTSYTYDPFGNVSINGATAQDLQWSSEHCDSELALVYYNFRHYSPSLGRWLSREPIGERGGKNLYAFLANTVLSTDCLGLFSAGTFYPPNAKIGPWTPPATKGHAHLVGLALEFALGAEVNPDCIAKIRERVTDANLDQDSPWSWGDKLWDDPNHYNRDPDKSASDAREKFNEKLATWQTEFDTATANQDCGSALDALGKMSHAWQDFYAHGIFGTGDFGGFADIPPELRPTPENPGDFWPSSFAVIPPWGEHPPFWEPSFSPEDARARYNAALMYTTQKFSELLSKWRAKCQECFCCECED